MQQCRARARVPQDEDGLGMQLRARDRPGMQNVLHERQDAVDQSERRNGQDAERIWPTQLDASPVPPQHRQPLRQRQAAEWIIFQRPPVLDLEPVDAIRVVEARRSSAGSCLQLVEAQRIGFGMRRSAAHVQKTGQKLNTEEVYRKVEFGLLLSSEFLLRLIIIMVFITTPPAR